MRDARLLTAGLLLGLVLSLIVTASSRADVIPFPATNQVVAAPGFVQMLPWSMCQNMPSTLQACGQNIRLPTVAPNSTSISLTMPPPYLPEPLTVRCIATGTGAQIWLDTTGLTCRLQPCAATTISLCGASFSLPGETPVGTMLTIPVPNSDLVPTAATQNLSFTAQCAVNGTRTEYQLNTSSVSCNLFPCQDSTITLCDVPVPIKGGAAMGDVLHLTMPLPFTPDPFLVQCLGSNGLQPSYQLMDHAAVTCNRQNQP